MRLLRFCVVTLAFAWATHGFALQAPGQSTEKIVRFPSEKSLGWLEVMDAQMDWREAFEHIDFPSRETSRQLRGEFAIPSNKKLLLLFFDSNASERKVPVDLSPLDQFDSDDLLILLIPASIIGADEISHLTRHKALRYLVLGPLSTVSDAALEHVGKITWLEGLDIADTNATDAGLKHLRTLKNLEKLNLYGTKMTDQAIQVVIGLPRLQTLNLGRTKVTDAGLEILASADALESLDLQGTKISEIGITHLKGLPELTSLNLRDTSITDRQLQSVLMLPKLRRIYLGTNQINDTMRKEFQQLMPGLRIIVPKTPPMEP